MEQILTNSERQDEQVASGLPQPKTAINAEDEILFHAFLTIDEVATLLRVSKRTVYNLIYKGVLPATKVTYHVTVIQRQDFLDMLERNRYVRTTVLPKAEKHNDSLAPRKGTKKSKCNAEQGTGIDNSEKDEQKNSSAKAKAKKPRKQQARQLIPSSAYQKSVRDTFTDKEYKEEELYTMAEICRKYDCKYGWFYNVRMRYNIPCIKANSTKCFPIAEVDKAIREERERLGSDLAEHWYTCFDIMRIYGLGKTQVRRFAETHDVRIRKCGHCNHYLKADWEVARKKAEMKSTSTKARRE